MTTQTETDAPEANPPTDELAPHQLARPITAASGPEHLAVVYTDGTVDADARLIRLLADRMETRLSPDYDGAHLDRARPESRRVTLTSLADAVHDIAAVVEAIVDDAVQEGTRPLSEQHVADWTTAMEQIQQASDGIDYFAGWL